MSGGPRAFAAHVEELRARRVPFVQATVVRARRPTSARPGDRALVLADGTVEGFVGGVCAESTVRLHGLKVLASGRPLVLRITPDAERVGDPGDSQAGDVEDTVTVANPCLSGGAVEVFLEPQLPAPLVQVFGDSPIARALREVGEVLGYDVREGELEAELEAEAEAEVEAVVVASHGGDEERVLTAALRAGVPYVGLIASPRRGRAVLSALSEPAADRVHTPAGLDIGARTPHEIAVSVYAELIATHMRRPGLGAEFRETEAPSTVDLRDHTPGSGLARVPGTPAAGEIVEAVDPVCGMTVAVSPVTPRADHGGRRYHFCCTGCADRFRADPTRYVSTSETHAP